MKSRWPLYHPARLDRAAHRRALVDPAAATAIVVRDGAVLAVDGALVELPPGHHPEQREWMYLGCDEGTDYVAVVPSGPGEADDGIGAERMTGLRDFVVANAAREDGQRDAELAATAVALSTWHATHGRCSLCGEPSAAAVGGWSRRCEPCGREHYPRTDPAVIVAITDEHDRMLLAHASAWSPRRYSHLAGYVEPGESLEQAVHREVAEESGLRLEELRYVGSQPWPFPASLMAGFTARAEGGVLAVDGEEVTDARFFEREELTAAVADGEVVPAPPGSISRAMLDQWWGR